MDTTTSQTFPHPAAGVMGSDTTSSRPITDQVADGAASADNVGKRVLSKTGEKSTSEPINWGLRIISIILAPFFVIGKIFHLAIMGLSYLLGLCCCSCCCRDAKILIDLRSVVPSA